MKFKTLYDGERAVLINRNGEVKHIDGPQRVCIYCYKKFLIYRLNLFLIYQLFLILTKMEKLYKVTASHNQYLVLKKLNGEIENIPG